MQDLIDFSVLVFILGGVVYGLVTLGFWFAFVLAIFYIWMRLGNS